MSAVRKVFLSVVFRDLKVLVGRSVIKYVGAVCFIEIIQLTRLLGLAHARPNLLPSHGFRK